MCTRVELCRSHSQHFRIPRWERSKIWRKNCFQYLWRVWVLSLPSSTQFSTCSVNVAARIRRDSDKEKVSSISREIKKVFFFVRLFEFANFSLSSLLVISFCCAGACSVLDECECHHKQHPFMACYSHFLPVISFFLSETHFQHVPMTNFCFGFGFSFHHIEKLIRTYSSSCALYWEGKSEDGGEEPDNDDNQMAITNCVSQTYVTHLFIVETRNIYGDSHQPLTEFLPDNMRQNKWANIREQEKTHTKIYNKFLCYDSDSNSEKVKKKTSSSRCLCTWRRPSVIFLFWFLSFFFFLAVPEVFPEFHKCNLTTVSCGQS